MGLHSNAYMATVAFLLGCTFGPVLLSALQRLPQDHLLTLALVGHQVLVHGFVMTVFWSRRQEAVSASFLGSLLSFGVAMGYLMPFPWPMFWSFVAALAFFHWSEYISMCWCQPDDVTWDCFMLNHSRAYWLAHTFSLVESVVTFIFIPSIKIVPVYFLGLAMVVGGELLRKAGMFTAATSFSHRIALVKRPTHTLITHGVYRWCRHPAYVGWFYWSIGTQVMLCNPISAVAFTLASWRFFNERIAFEEFLLVQFYGQEYREYQGRVGTGLPFIHGCE